MGVYIPKMEMPRNCSFCPCARMNISRNGIECSAVDFYAENLMPQKERMECCPLVEVKPHGRLIDADALMGEIQDYIEEYSWYTDEHGFHSDKWCAMKETEMAINAAPTIVEADNNTQNMRDESEGKT